MGKTRGPPRKKTPTMEDHHLRRSLRNRRDDSQRTRFRENIDSRYGLATGQFRNCKHNLGRLTSPETRGQWHGELSRKGRAWSLERTRPRHRQRRRPLYAEFGEARTTSESDEATESAASIANLSDDVTENANSSVITTTSVDSCSSNQNDGRKTVSNSLTSANALLKRSSFVRIVNDYIKAGIEEGKRRAKRYIRKALAFGVRSGYLIPADTRGQVLRLSSTLMRMPRRADAASRRRRREMRRGDEPTEIVDRKSLRRSNSSWDVRRRKSSDASVDVKLATKKRKRVEEDAPRLGTTASHARSKSKATATKKARAPRELEIAKKRNVQRRTRKYEPRRAKKPKNSMNGRRNRGAGTTFANREDEVNIDNLDGNERRRTTNAREEKRSRFRGGGNDNDGSIDENDDNIDDNIDDDNGGNNGDKNGGDNGGKDGGKNGGNNDQEANDDVVEIREVNDTTSEMEKPSMNSSSTQETRESQPNEENEKNSSRESNGNTKNRYDSMKKRRKDQQQADVNSDPDIAM